jgi:putative transposase
MTGSKKNLNSLPHNRKKLLLEINAPHLPLSRQCELLGISRSSTYYTPRVNPADLTLMNEIDKIYTKSPFYGKRRLCHALKRLGYDIGVKHTCSLMKKMGIAAIYPGPKTSIPNREHKVYPYLLRDLIIHRPNQVWATDITYIKLAHGFIYLVAILDWYSRYVISWRLSNTLEADFCIEALEEALMVNQPEIFNADQGSQFTAKAFTGVLESSGVAISMDGKGRCYDNIFTERLWRTVKYEEVYLKSYRDPAEARNSLKGYFHFYNNERLHQSLDYMTPSEIHFVSTSR